MKVLEFNTNNGIYSFELGNFNTEFHAHPAYEIVIATDGNFSVLTSNSENINLSFAVIEANVRHKVLAYNCRLELLMIEHNNLWIKTILAKHNIDTESGIYVESTIQKRSALFHYLQQNFCPDERRNYDDRIHKCLEFFESENVEYSLMVKELQNKVHLSESRLSHLFKDEIGVSLKKYLVWSRLKKTINSVLENQENLFSASMRCGFYDQAHFSKTFKETLGISPSEVYNSRTLQD
ncbi:MAG: helix-turn-helix transcriptional regulator [Bacteroidota bacterium]